MLLAKIALYALMLAHTLAQSSKTDVTQWYYRRRQLVYSKTGKALLTLTLVQLIYHSVALSASHEQSALVLWLDYVACGLVSLVFVLMLVIKLTFVFGYLICPSKLLTALQSAWGQPT